MRRRICFVLLSVVLVLSLSPQAVVPVWGYRTVRRLHRISLQPAALTANTNLSTEEEDMLRQQIEEARAILKNEFGWDPHPKLRLVVDAELNARGISGYYQLGTIVIAPPSPDKLGEYQKSGPILHEMTHLVVDYLAHGNYPAWLTEGIAVYMEVKHQGGSWIDLREGRAWTSVYMLDSALQSSNAETLAAAYWQAYVLVRHLYNQNPHGVRELLVELGRGETMENALRKIYNLTVSELEQRAWLSLRNQQEAVR